jgi:hypothetical protein
MNKEKKLTIMSQINLKAKNAEKKLLKCKFRMMMMMMSKFKE